MLQVDFKSYIALLFSYRVPVQPNKNDVDVLVYSAIVSRRVDYNEMYLLEGGRDMILIEEECRS